MESSGNLEAEGDFMESDQKSGKNFGSKIL